MSTWRFIVRSLAYHWRIHLAVALGVAAATAVLTGALLVGDSVRGSLRRLTLDRLGRIDEVLVTDRFFAAELVARLKATPGFREHFSAATPANSYINELVTEAARLSIGQNGRHVAIDYGGTPTVRLRQS